MATLENLLSKMVEKINNKVSTSEQVLTNEQQEQVRLNIGALSQEQVLHHIDEKEIAINYDPSLISFSFDLEEGMTFSKISNDTFTPDEFQGGIFVNKGQEITLTKDLLDIETELEVVHTYSLGGSLGMIVCFSSFQGLDKGIYIIDLQQYNTYVKRIRYIKSAQEKIQINLLPENGFGYMKYAPVPLFTWNGSGASPYIYPKESPVGVTDIDSLGRVADTIPNLDKITSFTLSIAGILSKNVSDFRIAGPMDLDGRYYTTFIDNEDDTILMLIADTEIRINSHSSMMVDENNKFEPHTFPAGIYLFAADGWYVSEILGDGEAPSLIDLKYLPLFKDQNTSTKKELIFNQMISISSSEYRFDSPIILEDNQWYEIAYGGQSYVAQCTFMTMDGMSGYALGNLAFFTDDENDNNGMPFLMGTIEGMGTVLISPLVNGTVLFSVAKLSYPLIDSKYLPYDKPDWHTTDASDASYIKNKPLLINSSFTPIVENYKCKAGFQHDIQLLDILSTKQLGKKYRFICDNIEYQGPIVKAYPAFGCFDSKNKKYPYEDVVYMNMSTGGLTEITQPVIGFQHEKVVTFFPDSEEHTISLYVETYEHEVDYSYFHTLTPSWDLGTKKPLNDELESYQELIKLSQHLQAGQIVYGQFNGNPVQILEISGSNDGDFFIYKIKCTNGLINYLIKADYGPEAYFTITEEINTEAAHAFIDKNIDYIYDKIIERTEQLKNS